jgi:hypothetical protein
VDLSTLKDIASELREEKRRDQEHFLANSEDDAHRRYFGASLKHNLFADCCSDMQTMALNGFKDWGDPKVLAHEAALSFPDGHPRHHITVVEVGQDKGPSRYYLLDPSFQQFMPPTDEAFKEIYTDMYKPDTSDCRRAERKEDLPAYKLMSDPQTKGWCEDLMRDGVVELTPEVAKRYFDSFQPTWAYQGNPLMKILPQEETLRSVPGRGRRNLNAVMGGASSAAVPSPCDATLKRIRQARLSP